jgi:carbohydrate kinase (thermoresistant glucokinase family)
MGVSGCGKSALGRALANKLGWHFIEGDALHPAANIAKMAAGVALDDEDRQLFLERVAAAMSAARSRGAVASCSALKRSYRDFIRTQAGDVLFVLLQLDREALAARLEQRRDHFMPASLRDSQLATLEAPAADERAVVVDGAAATAAQVARVLAALRAASAVSQGKEAEL